MWLTRNGTRLKELEDRVASLEELHRDLNDLPVQWEDWLHKIRNVLARLNRRADREEGEIPTARAINPAAARLLGIHNGESA